MSGDFWFGLGAGLLIGGTLGAFAMALMAAASAADTRLEAYAANDSDLDLGDGVDGDADCAAGDSGAVGAELERERADFYQGLYCDLVAEMSQAAARRN